MKAVAERALPAGWRRDAAGNIWNPNDLMHYWGYPQGHAVVLERIWKRYRGECSFPLTAITWMTFCRNCAHLVKEVRYPWQRSRGNRIWTEWQTMQECRYTRDGFTASMTVLKRCPKYKSTTRRASYDKHKIR